MEQARRLVEWGATTPGPAVAPPTAEVPRRVPARAPGEDPPESSSFREPVFLRLMAGFIYFYFGFLKFYPDLSPGELIATEALTRVSDHLVDARTALFGLAVVEVSIGLSLLFKFQLRWMFYVFLVHQVGTFLPLFILPELTFKIAPFAPTMEGQYIIKNLVSLAAGLTVMLPAVRAEAGRKAARESEAPGPRLRLQQ